MGLYKKLFGGGGKIEPKELPLEERIALLKKRADEDRELILGKVESNARKMLAAFGEVREVIIGMQGKEPAEKTARGSSAVKDRFCSVSLRQLDALMRGSVNMSDVDEIENFLSGAKEITLSLGGITRQQMAHLAFFFEDDMKKVSRKIKEAESLSNSTRLLLKPLLDYRKLQEGLEKRNMLEAEKARKLEGLNEIRGKITSMEDSLKKPGGNDLPLHESETAKKLEKDIESAEAALRQAETDAISYLPIGKPLRRYKYVTGSQDPLLDMYISDVKEAMLRDSELRIIGMLSDFLRINEKGRIEDNDKKIAMIREIIENQDMLRAKRKSLIESKKGLAALRKEMDSIMAPLIKEKQESERSRVQAENMLKELRKQEAATHAEMGDIEKELENQMREITRLASL